MAKHYQPNDFRGAPRKRFLGIGSSLGGFHTASSKDVTYGYAQTRSIPPEADHVAPGEARMLRISNYPVTVTLDMKGLRSRPDYDALKVRPALQRSAKQALEEAARNGTSPLHELATTAELTRVAPTDDAVQWLFRYGSRSVYYPEAALLAFASRKRDSVAFLQAVSDSELSDRDLAHMVGQFLYRQDVSEQRIVAVDYVQPWWPNILDAQVPHERRLSRALKESGWSVIDAHDVEQGELPVAEMAAYRRRKPKGARIEYHGTSYLNLLSAAPVLAAKLPKPPPPYHED